MAELEKHSPPLQGIVDAVTTAEAVVVTDAASVTVTVYVPGVTADRFCEVAPFDHANV